MRKFFYKSLLLSLGGLILAVPAGAQSITDMGRGVTAAMGTQGRLIWVDGTANIFRTVKVNGKDTIVDYTTTPQGVAEIVRRCKEAHINTLVVDVKPLSGQVLYNSRVAPHMRSWKGHSVPDFDVLAAFVAEGHKAGLQVDASINVLSEGHKYFSVGPAYEHPDWQSVVYTVDRGLVAPDWSRLSVRVPSEPDNTAKPPILTENDTILGGEPISGMVGLESTERESSVVHGEAGTPLGHQLHIVLDADNHVAGMVDSALLGDDPLLAPEGGHLIPVTRPADRTWAAQHLKAGATVRFDLQRSRTPIAQAASEKVACFVNPLNPEARRHELDIVRELVTNYDIDGLVLDRLRYSNQYNDFSDLTRQAFTRWLGRPIFHWPEDVYAFSSIPGQPIVEGALYEPWLEFRAQVIRDMAADIARCARAIKPCIVLGTYVGSWYPKYWEVGVNWGSEKTHLRYSWFPPNYPQTGYAEFFDWISTGCYYPIPTIEDARREGASEHGTVEYAAELSNLAVANGAFVYAGVYVPDYIHRPDAFVRALDAGARNSQGFMIFDLSQVDEYNWWPVLDKAWSQDVSPPDRLPNLLPTLRAAMDSAQ
ncbi:MAG TPA: alpha amylase family protein [Chthonomonadaceae bacterium]|nr:alpha amylase family protein [Chthonomonadaceae bacterium]